MKRPYKVPAVCGDALLASLCFLVGSNEGYDVDIIDTGLSTTNLEWL